MTGRQCVIDFDGLCGNPASWAVSHPARGGRPLATCGDHLDDACTLLHEYGCPVTVACLDE